LKHVIAVVLVSAVLGSSFSLLGSAVGLTLEHNRSIPVRAVFGISFAVLVGCLCVLFTYY
jgi:hypothetical protein